VPEVNPKIEYTNGLTAGRANCGQLGERALTEKWEAIFTPDAARRFKNQPS
jgi:hypothetical protein